MEEMEEKKMQMKVHHYDTLSYWDEKEDPTAFRDGGKAKYRRLNLRMSFDHPMATSESYFL